MYWQSLRVGLVAYVLVRAAAAPPGAQRQRQRGATPRIVPGLLRAQWDSPYRLALSTQYSPVEMTLDALMMLDVFIFILFCLARDRREAIAAGTRSLTLFMPADETAVVTATTEAQKQALALVRARAAAPASARGGGRTHAGHRAPPARRRRTWRRRRRRSTASS